MDFSFLPNVGNSFLSKQSTSFFISTPDKCDKTLLAISKPSSKEQFLLKPGNNVKHICRN